MSGCFLLSEKLTGFLGLYTDFAVLFYIADSESLCQDVHRDLNLMKIKIFKAKFG